MNLTTEQMPERNEYGEVNIGWWAGLIDERRTFFSECWAVDGITMLTIVVSTEGIEDKTPEQLDEMFQKAGYYKQRNPGQLECLRYFVPMVLDSYRKRFRE